MYNEDDSHSEVYNEDGVNDRYMLHIWIGKSAADFIDSNFDKSESLRFDKYCENKDESNETYLYGSLSKYLPGPYVQFWFDIFCRLRFCNNIVDFLNIVANI